MIVLSKLRLQILKEEDVVLCRVRVKEMALKIGMGLVDQTKLITATSELARNILKYGKGGNVLIEVVSDKNKNGIKLTFQDSGPGIKDINLAMKDGYSTSKGLGLGLPGAKRLVDEFDIQSAEGIGTTITISKWKNG